MTDSKHIPDSTQAHELRVIEVYAEPTCPFAYVGLTRLSQRIEQLGADLAIRIRPWPLELINGAPLEPEMTSRKVAALRAQIAPELFTGFTTVTAGHSSVQAMALESAAYAISDSQGLATAMQLRTIYFEQGHALTPDILAPLAQRSGLTLIDYDQALEIATDGWRQDSERGVIGSPHFFTRNGSFFCPSMSIKHHGDDLVITANPTMLDELIAQALDER